jgi:hypothetical protein
MGTEAKESHRLMAGYFSRPAIMDTENQKRTAFPAVLLIFAIDICLGACSSEASAMGSISQQSFWNL